MPTEMGTVTLALRRLRDGDPAAEAVLLDLLYEELHRLAHKALRRERAGHTLQTTDVVHEAYLRLCDQATADLRDRAHFMALAARVMRRLLIDHARARKARKRPQNRVELTDHLKGEFKHPDQTLIMDEALRRLAALDERQATIVEMRYYGNATEEEIAQHLDISVRTVKREWRSAKAWLYRELGGNECADEKDGCHPPTNGEP